jgi:GntR family transcriptional regulator/MocR family aminotransferase
MHWANSGVDLLLELPGPRRRAGLEDALRDAVRSGRLVPGTLLPSSRALSAELGLARNTVADAYSQLVAEGWLTARQGAGTRVADRRQPTAGHATIRHPTLATGRRRTYDLAPGTPDLAGFPRSGWLAAARRAMTAAPSHEFGYPDPRGLPGLRETLAHYLARVRGVRTMPDHIIICSGFVQALNLLSTALHRRGAGVMAVESYGFGTHRDVIRAAGLATRPLTVDSSGARIDDLAGVPADAALLTPAHQFPLGVPLAAPRRSAVLRWARDNGTLIIEDDYDGEFRYDRRPLGALQSLDPDLVAYAGTASKSLAPGLSLAWLAAPPRLIDILVETKRLSDGHTGIVEQLTLDEFIRSGAYDRHIRRSRLRYRRRRDRLAALLAERSPDVTVTGVAAGLHAVLELGRGLRTADEAGIVSRAARAGLTVQGLGEFSYDADPGARAGYGPAASPSHQPGTGAALVVGYGTPPDHAFAGALDTLCDVLA